MPWVLFPSPFTALSSWLWQLPWSRKATSCWPHRILRTRKLVIYGWFSLRFTSKCLHGVIIPTLNLLFLSRRSTHVLLTPSRPFYECLAYSRIPPIPFPRLGGLYLPPINLCCRLHFLQENTHYPSEGKDKMPISLQTSESRLPCRSVTLRWLQVCKRQLIATFENKIWQKGPEVTYHKLRNQLRLSAYPSSQQTSRGIHSACSSGLQVEPPL